MHVGLKHVDDAGAVVGSDLDLLVHVSRGVNDNAPSRLFRADPIAVIGQTLDSGCLNKHFVSLQDVNTDPQIS